VTVAVAVGLFVPFEAVSVYVVVAPGVTPWEPEATGATEPMPWLMLVLVQFIVDHERTEELPTGTEAGDALKEEITHPADTVTVAVAVGEAMPSVAVSVYVVVAPGVMTLEPEVATAPTPWLMDALLQLAVTHDRVAEPPVEMLVGLTVNEVMVHGGNMVRVAIAVGLFVPSEAVSVYVVVNEGLTLLLLFTPTEPIPWLMDALVQFDVLQYSVEE
jgi:hypothetical protein